MSKEQSTPKYEVGEYIAYRGKKGKIIGYDSSMPYPYVVQLVYSSDFINGYDTTLAQEYELELCSGFKYNLGDTVALKFSSSNYGTVTKRYIDQGAAYYVVQKAHGCDVVREDILRPYSEVRLKYQEGEEVYYKDGTVQVISAIGNPNDPCPYHIGTIKVPERDLRPRDISLEEFKSKFCNALKNYTVKQVLELALLYPDRAREYYETLA